MVRHSAYVMDKRVPPSTPQVLVFPWDHKLKRFNTSSYNPQFTEGRTNAQEIEAFLAEIQVPVDEYVAEFGHLWAPPCWLVLLHLICYLLLPIGIILICYHVKQINESKVKLDEVRQRAGIIAKEKGGHFLQKDLMWVLPNYFPRWIELWTTLKTSNNNHMSINMNMHSQSYMDQSDISLNQMPQKNYQNSIHPEQGGFNQNRYR